MSNASLLIDVDPAERSRHPKNLKQPHNDHNYRNSVGDIFDLGVHQKSCVYQPELRSDYHKHENKTDKRRNYYLLIIYTYFYFFAIFCL